MLLCIPSKPFMKQMFFLLVSKDPKYEHLRWLVTFIKRRSSSSNIDSLGASEDYSETLGADQRASRSK